jgi:glycosyltransferase involved in cell wall biosynthesis
MKELIQAEQARDFLSLERSIAGSVRQSLFSWEGGWSSLEREAVLRADLIVPNSDSVMCLYRELFPSQTGKIFPDVIWNAEWIYRDALGLSFLRRSFSERDVDVLFIANRWSRREKNYALVKEIIARCAPVNAHIVGEAWDRSARAAYHGFLASRTELFRLLGRAKTVVCPSLFDAAPGVLFQASAMECNVIASRNCGNWRICNEELLVEPFTLDNFVEKISLSLERRYADHIDYFVGNGAYGKLLDALAGI